MVENPVEGDLSKYYVESGDDYAQATSFDATATYYTLTVTYSYTKVDAATAAGATSGTLYVVTTTPATKEEITDDAIMPLTQNTAHKLSVLVYLDGNTVANKDVAATGSSSMKGTMNLQFSSSANLVPMEYADLHIPGATTTYTVTPVVPENSGITLNSTSKLDGSEDYVFELNGTAQGTTYTVSYKVGDGESKTLNAADGKYTIPKAEIKGNIVITVTATT